MPKKKYREKAAGTTPAARRRRRVPAPPQPRRTPSATRPGTKKPIPGLSYIPQKGDFDDRDDGDENFSKERNIAFRSDPVLTRRRHASLSSRVDRPTVTLEQREMQRKVYAEMPAPSMTSMEYLKQEGKPYLPELETSRVMPDLHAQAAIVRYLMRQGEGGPSTIIFKYDQIRKKHAVFALVQESLKYFHLIESLCDDIDFYKRHRRAEEQKDLLHVLLYDMLWGKGLNLAWPSEMAKAVITERSAFEQALIKRTSEGQLVQTFQGTPKYVRVNVIQTTTEAVITSFVDKGLRLLSNISPYKYETLGVTEFCVDKDVPDLLVFSNLMNLSGLEQDTKYIIQNKASCFPALVLLDPTQPTKPQGVLDACSAPGNKTIHLACLLGQKTDKKDQAEDYEDVPLIAVERDANRYKTLCERTKKAGAKVKTINGDFLALNPNKYKNVTHILVDPSCSGSGIVSSARSAEKAKPKNVDRKAILGHIPFNKSKGPWIKYQELHEGLPDDWSEEEWDSDVDDEEEGSEKEGEEGGEKGEEEEGGEEEGDDGDESEYDSEKDEDYEQKEDAEEEKGAEEESTRSSRSMNKEGQGETEETENKDDANNDDANDDASDDANNDEYNYFTDTTYNNNNNKNDNNENTDNSNTPTKTEEDADPFKRFSIKDDPNIPAEIKERISQLRKFQISVIKHAFRFPSVERVVYSTCSMHMDENELVVKEILEQTTDFELVPALPRWRHRGLEIFKGGSMCARASPDEDMTTGFFVACFQRTHKPKQEEEKKEENKEEEAKEEEKEMTEEEKQKEKQKEERERKRKLAEEKANRPPKKLKLRREDTPSPSLSSPSLPPPSLPPPSSSSSSSSLSSAKAKGPVPIVTSLPPKAQVHHNERVQSKKENKNKNNNNNNNDNEKKKNNQNNNNEKTSNKNNNNNNEKTSNKKPKPIATNLPPKKTPPQNNQNVKSKK